MRPYDLGDAAVLDSVIRELDTAHSRMNLARFNASRIDCISVAVII